MRLAAEIVATLFLVLSVGESSVAFAAPRLGRSADGVSCGFSVPQNASPAQRCAAIRRQCGGRFYANLLQRQAGRGSVRIRAATCLAARPPAVQNKLRTLLQVSDIS
jgi:hypothetical protein